MRGMRSRKNVGVGNSYAVRRRCAKGGLAAPNKFSFRAEMKKKKRGEGERVNVLSAAKRHGRGENKRIAAKLSDGVPFGGMHRIIPGWYLHHNTHIP